MEIEPFLSITNFTILSPHSILLSVRTLENKTRIFQKNLDLLASERGVALEKYISAGSVSYCSVHFALVVHLMAGVFRLSYLY